MYESLFKSWMKEKESEALQSLDEDFYQKLNRYLNGLKRELKRKEEPPIRLELLKEEYKNSVYIAGRLIHRRIGKILESVLEGRKIPLETLTKEEKEIGVNANKLVEAITELKRRLFKEGHKAVAKPTVIRLLQRIPEIVGVDMEIYGPFEAEDVAVLPEENARALIKRGAAKEIEYRK
ncbi:TPA: hypothetical protein EYP26_00835 [Candidatus Bathyarchaeota archaeon]|nr:hypothetical protein [Candidatus Bathyarchaeota archaeon]